jgi:hypothetical protein
MKHIKATLKQRERREVFKQAVRYAQWIYADPDRKKAFLKTVKRRKHRAFQYAMKLYLHASPIRQLHLKLTMLKSCLLQNKLQREATKAKNTYFNLEPWKQLWPTNQRSKDPLKAGQPSTNSEQRSMPFTISSASLCPEPYAPLRENLKLKKVKQMDLNHSPFTIDHSRSHHSLNKQLFGPASNFQ